MFQGERNVSDSTHKTKKEILENEISELIENMIEMNTDELMGAISEFHQYPIDGYYRKQDQFKLAISDLTHLKRFIWFAPVVMGTSSYISICILSNNLHWNLWPDSSGCPTSAWVVYTTETPFILKHEPYFLSLNTLSFDLLSYYFW